MPPLTTNANIPGRMSIVKNRRLYVEFNLSLTSLQSPPKIRSTNYPSSKPKALSEEGKKGKLTDTHDVVLGLAIHLITQLNG